MATAAQASKEFHHMHKPKITKLKRVDTLQTWNLCSSHGMQILKLTLGIMISITLQPFSWSKIKPRRVHSMKSVSTQSLWGGHKLLWTPQTSQCCISNVNSSNISVLHFKANILEEFYSWALKPKESEEAFVDELQLLTHKVISKHPDFRKGLDTTLKQHYANQLYDHNNALIAKTLLIQMPTVTFTQFCN